MTLPPFLRHYLGGTGTQACQPTGSTGSWNAFTGATRGWTPVSFDLSAYAGRQVEGVDQLRDRPGLGRRRRLRGRHADHHHGRRARVRGLRDGRRAVDGHGPAAGQPAEQTAWEIGPKLINFYAGTSTEDTLLLGFGVEQLATEAERADLLRRALGGLLG